MNAIIALCHFCDQHGPRTLFCTQAFKYKDQTQQHQSGSTLNNLSELLLMEASSNDSTTDHIVLNSAAPSSKLSFSPETSTSRRQSIQHNKRISSNTSQSSLFSSIDSINSTCKACRAFEKDFHHYISYDNNNESIAIESKTSNICYISQSTPSDSEVFALVRKACLRTLHCEVFEDPIYFDDDKNGSVIGYEFHIKDSEGRGQQRSYSLLIIMKDRIYLQHLWSFLSQQISIIASNIKSEAQAKFDKELPLFTNLNQPNFNAQSIRQLSNPNKRTSTTRGLIELTDDPLIFAKLHMWFV
jgi:folliculin